MAPTIKGPLGSSIRRRNTGIKRERVDQGGRRVATSADERSERGRTRKNRIKWTDRIVTKHTRIEIEGRWKKTTKKRKRRGRKGGQLTFDSKVFQRNARRRPLPWITYLFHFASTTWSGSRKPQRSWVPPQGKTFGLRTSRVKNLSALKLIRQRSRARALARSQVRFECL